MFMLLSVRLHRLGVRSLVTEGETIVFCCSCSHKSDSKPENLHVKSVNLLLVASESQVFVKQLNYRILSPISTYFLSGFILY